MWRTSETQKRFESVVNSGQSFILFDLETTGLNPQKTKTSPACKITQIAAMKLRFVDGKLEVGEKLNQYLNPECELSPVIIEKTGLTNEFLKDKPTENEIFYSVIYPFFNGEDVGVVCGYNVNFDVRFMRALYERQGEAFLVDEEIDVMKMAKDIISRAEAGNHKLETITKMYGLDDGLQFHNAMDDIVATSRLLRIFKNEYDKKNEAFENNAHAELKKAIINSVNYWEGYRGNKRIYINTNIGTFYYGIIEKEWGEKKGNPYKMNEVDMEHLRLETFKFTKCYSEEELSKYRK